MRGRHSIIGAACAALIVLTTVQAAAAAEPPISPGHLAYPSGGTTAVGAGIDAADQNAQLAESLPAQVYLSWSAAPPKCPSAANSGARSISVAGTRTVVVERQYQCSYVSAYDTSTGALAWRRSYHFAGTAQVVGSSVYVAHDDPATSQTKVDSLSLSSGAVLWSTIDADMTGRMTLAVGSGLVATPGWVLDAATGAHRFSLSQSGPTIIAGGVIYVNGSKVQAYSATGKLLWSTPKPASAGMGTGAALPSLHNGVLYIANPNAYTPTSPAVTLALNAQTGKLLRTLPGSGTPLALDGNVGITTTTAYNDSTIVSAVDLTTGWRYWSTKLPAFPSGPATLLNSVPIVENGLVWLVVSHDTGTPARLVALNEITGAIANSITEPCYQGEGSPVIAQHRIFTPSDCGVLTFTTTKPAQLLPDPGFESSAGGWAALPGGTETLVSSPVHTGAHSLKVTPSTASQYVSGVTQNSAIPKAVAGRLYMVSCWVRASATGLDLRAQVREFSPDLATEYYQPSTTLPWVTGGTWMQLTASARALHSGDRMEPRVFASGSNANTIPVVFDDCSVISG